MGQRIQNVELQITPLLTPPTNNSTNVTHNQHLGEPFFCKISGIFLNFCKQHKNSLHTFCTSPDGASKRKGEADTQRTPGCTQGQGTKVFVTLNGR